MSVNVPTFSQSSRSSFPFLPFSMSPHSMAIIPLTAARRLPQKGGREETDLGAKHRVSHCIGVVREPRNLTLIKGIIFTIYLYCIYIYILYIYIYILCIYIYIYMCVYVYIFI